MTLMNTGSLAGSALNRYLPLGARGRGALGLDLGRKNAFLLIEHLDQRPGHRLAGVVLDEDRERRERVHDERALGGC